MKLLLILFTLPLVASQGYRYVPKPTVDLNVTVIVTDAKDDTVALQYEVVVIDEQNVTIEIKPKEEKK
jgi:hypothetical protein